MVPSVQGETGKGVVLKLAEPDPNAKAVDDGEMDSFFPLHDSVIVFDLSKTVNGLLAEHKKQLAKYNRKLTTLKINLKIRLTHTAVIKNKKYTYCGRYLYKRLKGGKEEYVGKLDNMILRNEIRDKWNAAGPPPRNPLEGFKYQSVLSNDVDTGAVVVPVVVYTNPSFVHLFSGKTSYRVRGER